MTTPSRTQTDWSADMTARVESLVGAVRDKTTVPATTVAKILVYGLVVGVLGAAMFIASVIGLIRLLDVYLPFHPLARRVWVVDGGASAIFLLTGMLLWRRRRPKTA